MSDKHIKANVYFACFVLCCQWLVSLYLSSCLMVRMERFPQIGWTPSLSKQHSPCLYFMWFDAFYIRKSNIKSN